MIVDWLQQSDDEYFPEEDKGLDKSISKVFKCIECNHSIYSADIVVHDKKCPCKKGPVHYEIPEYLLEEAEKAFISNQRNLEVLKNLVNLKLTNSNEVEVIKLLQILEKIENFYKCYSMIKLQSNFTLTEFLEISENLIKNKQVFSFVPGILQVNKVSRKSEKFRKNLDEKPKLSRNFNFAKVDSENNAKWNFKAVFNKWLLAQFDKKIICINFETCEALFTLKVSLKFCAQILGNMEYVIFYKNDQLTIWNICFRRVEKIINIGKISSFDVHFNLNKTRAIFLNPKSQRSNEFDIFSLDLNILEINITKLKLDESFKVFIVSNDIDEFYFANRNILFVKEGGKKCLYTGSEEISMMCFSNDSKKIIFLGFPFVKVLSISSETTELIYKFENNTLKWLSFLTSDRKILVLNSEIMIDLDRIELQKNNKKTIINEYILQLTSSYIGISKMSLFKNTEKIYKNLFNYIRKTLHNSNDLQKIKFLSTSSQFYLCETLNKISIFCPNSLKNISLRMNNEGKIRIIKNSDMFYISNKSRYWFWRSDSNYPKMVLALESDFNDSGQSNIKIRTISKHLVVSQNGTSCIIYSLIKENQRFISYNYESIIQVCTDRIYLKNGCKILKIEPAEYFPTILVKDKILKKYKQVFIIKENLIVLMNSFSLILMDLCSGLIQDRIEFDDFEENIYIESYFDLLLIKLSKNLYIYDLKTFSIVNKQNFMNIKQVYFEFTDENLFIIIMGKSFNPNKREKKSLIYNIESKSLEVLNFIDPDYERIGFNKNLFYAIDENYLKIYSLDFNRLEKIIERGSLENKVYVMEDLVFIINRENITIQSLENDKKLVLSTSSRMAELINSKLINTIDLLIIPEKKLFIIFRITNFYPLLEFSIYDLESGDIVYNFQENDFDTRSQIIKINECIYFTKVGNEFSLYLNNNFLRIETPHFPEYVIESSLKIPKGNEKNYFLNFVESRMRRSPKFLIETNERIIFWTSEKIMIFSKDGHEQLDEILVYGCIGFFLTKSGNIITYGTSTYIGTFDIACKSGKKVIITCGIDSLLFISNDDKKIFIKTKEWNFIQAIDIE